MRILVLNGPNINMLGTREPEIYGTASYFDLQKALRELAAQLNVDIDIMQSNTEGTLVDAIQMADARYQAVLLNAAAYTHTSIAILDAIRAVKCPVIEVHLSDPDTREAYRHVNYLREACVATFKGKGFESYFEAFRYAVELNS